MTTAAATGLTGISRNVWKGGIIRECKEKGVRKIGRGGMNGRGNEDSIYLGERLGLMGVGGSPFGNLRLKYRLL